MQRFPEKPPEIAHREADWDFARVHGQMPVEFESDYRTWKAMNALIRRWIHYFVIRQFRQGVAVFSEKFRIVIFHYEDCSGFELFGGDEERDEDLVDLVEYVAHESAGREDDGRNLVLVLANWWGYIPL